MWSIICVFFYKPEKNYINWNPLKKSTYLYQNQSLKESYENFVENSLKI
jgi:hypothetical protein